MQDNRFLGLAYLASFVLHLLLVAVILWVPLPEGESHAQAQEPEIELVILPDEVPAEEPEDDREPVPYNDIPERLATELPPDDPQFLSLHHSQAADQTTGGEGNTPTAELTAEDPQVAIQKEELADTPGVVYVPQLLPEVKGGSQPPDHGEQGQDQESRDAPLETRGGIWDQPSPAIAEGQEFEGEGDGELPSDEPTLEDWWGGDEPTILKTGRDGSSGDRGFDFDQRAVGSVGAGVVIDGDFSLNTYEWDFGPWMSRFHNELHRHWVAPYAFHLGVISGKTVIRIVIEKDGRPSSMEILETEGHQSLHDASLAALKAFVPYAPLPAHFPAEKLVLTQGLGYPAFR